MAKNKIHSPASQTSHKKEVFLEYYDEFCIIGKAAEAAGVCRRTVELWRKKDKAFREAFDDTKTMVIDRLTDEATRRAVIGVDEPVFYKGEICGYITKYSDSLLMLLLKAAAPEKYRDSHKFSMNREAKITIIE